MNTFKINRLKSKLITVRTHVWPGRAGPRTEPNPENLIRVIACRNELENVIKSERPRWMSIFFFPSLKKKQIYGWSLKSPRGQISSSRCHEGNLLENKKVLLATRTASKRKEVLKKKRHFTRSKPQRELQIVRPRNRRQQQSASSSSSSSSSCAAPSILFLLFD